LIIIDSTDTPAYAEASDGQADYELIRRIVIPNGAYFFMAL